MTSLDHTAASSSAALPADVSASALLRELASSVSACERVDGELDALLSQRVELERAVSKSVPNFLDQVEAVRRAQEGVGSTVQHSAASAQSLSSKVRDLDLSASHVSAALQRVESVLSLRHTISRVREKLASGALGSAGEELHKSLYLQQPIENDISFSMLMELERKVRDEVEAQAKQRYVRQARNADAVAAAAASSSGGAGGRNAHAQPATVLESKEMFKLARIWPKLGFNYRGLVMHCAQVRHECLSLIHGSGWSVQNQVEGALIDYTHNVGAIIDACNGFIVQHLLAVQNTFGNGSQIRLIQELLTNVIDVEVAAKLLERFMDDKKIREPARGSTQPADDICSRIKQINQKIMAASNQRAGEAALSYYNPRDASTSSHSSPLHIQHLDELLDELQTLAHDMENFLKGINSLTRQSLDLLTEAVSKEREGREEVHRKRNSTDADRKKADDAFARILADPQDLSAMPSVHQQHHRVMTLLQRMMQDDKNRKNILGITLAAEERTNVFAAPSSKPALSSDAIIPVSQLSLPPSSPFLIHGFGLDSALSTSSKLYDVQLTLIGKYVLIEEYYMNVNVEKACAIDSHDGSNFDDADGSSALSNAAHDDLEGELLEAEHKARERERLAQAGGLHSLASAAMTTLHSSSGGVDPYLYLTGLGGSLTGAGLPKSFVRKFATHKTSTLVDNVCFLYKKCMQRALKTSNRDAIYSILLRVHENFNRKLRRVFEGCIAHYEARFGSKKTSSITYALHANPGAYLFPGGSASNRSNLLGAWVSSATSGMASVGGGGAPSPQDVRRKVSADVSLLLTVNNLDSTLENMQALLKYIEAELEDMFGEEAAAANAAAMAHSNYTRGLSLEQLREKVHEFHSTFHAFDHLIHRGLQMVADNCWLRLLPRLAMLQAHASELYGQTDLSAAASEQSDLILSGYMELFRRDVGGLAALMSENNFYQLVFKLMKLTARFLENLVLPKQTTASTQHNNNAGDASDPTRLSFTQSGGVQFDKQVRSLTSFFTNDIAAHLERHFASNFFLYLQPLTGTGMGGHDSSVEFQQWRVSKNPQARQMFSKLSHVGSILSVDKPAEVLDYTERELFNLNKDEVRSKQPQRRARRLRELRV